MPKAETPRETADEIVSLLQEMRRKNVSMREHDAQLLQFRQGWGSRWGNRNAATRTMILDHSSRSRVPTICGCSKAANQTT